MRVNLGATTIPYTSQGEVSYQPKPDAWNELDGFSPLTPMLARFPDLDVSTLPGHRTIGDSLLDTSPLIVFDADTGERFPVWAELDMSGEHRPGKEVLFIRGARPFANGHRYIVALRRSPPARRRTPPSTPTHSHDISASGNRKRTTMPVARRRVR